MTLHPLEANPPLLIDADAVLASPISRKLFQAIARWQAQVIQTLCGMEQFQLVISPLLYVFWVFATELALKDSFGLFVPKRLDHLSIVSSKDTIVKKYVFDVGDLIVTLKSHPRSGYICRCRPGLGAADFPLPGSLRWFVPVCGRRPSAWRRCVFGRASRASWTR